jgi:uncharacterized membrane protein
MFLIRFSSVAVQVVAFSALAILISISRSAYKTEKRKKKKEKKPMRNYEMYKTWLNKNPTDPIPKTMQEKIMNSHTTGH